MPPRGTGADGQTFRPEGYRPPARGNGAFDGAFAACTPPGRFGKSPITNRVGGSCRTTGLYGGAPAPPAHIGKRSRMAKRKNAIALFEVITAAKRKEREAEV